MLGNNPMTVWLFGRPFDFRPYVSGDSLDLSNVPMTELPYSIRKLTTIRVANLSNMGLTSTQNIESLRLLEELDLSYNQLRSASGITNKYLQKLDLSFNQITSLTDFKSGSIRELNVSGNPLTDWRFPRLKKFQLDGVWTKMEPTVPREARETNIIVCSGIVLVSSLGYLASLALGIL